MRITQLLDALLFSEDIEVVIALFPERPLLLTKGNRELPTLHYLGQSADLRLGEKNVNMLRHHAETVDGESISLLRAA